MKNVICKLFGHRLMYWHEDNGTQYWTYLKYASTAPSRAVPRCYRCKEFLTGRHVPNQETQTAIREAMTRVSVKYFNTSEELMVELDTPEEEPK